MLRGVTTRQINRKHRHLAIWAGALGTWHGLEILAGWLPRFPRIPVSMESFEGCDHVFRACFMHS